MMKKHETPAELFMNPRRFTVDDREWMEEDTVRLMIERPDFLVTYRGLRFVRFAKLLRLTRHLPIGTRLRVIRSELRWRAYSKYLDSRSALPSALWEGLAALLASPPGRLPERADRVWHKWERLEPETFGIRILEVDRSASQNTKDQK